MTIIRNNSLKKNEILSKKNEINEIFLNGRSSLEKPIVTYFLKVSYIQDSPVKVLFAVPKKRINKANKRNYVKRQLKEAYRNNKHDLINVCSIKRIGVNIAFIYSDSGFINYFELEKKIILSLQKIVDTINT